MDNARPMDNKIGIAGIEIPFPVFIVLIACASVAVTGILFAGHALYIGHHHALGTTREVPWGILIAGYVFFATFSTGLCIIASLGQVFGIKAFKPIVGRTIFLAAITIAAGLMSISLELENPWRVQLWALLSPHPESNIWWKTSIYSMYLMLLIFNLILLNRGKVKAASRVGLVALLACLAAILNMKEDMSILGARAFWPDQYMPIYFLTLATLLACFGIFFFTWAAARINRNPISADVKTALSATSKLSIVLLLIYGLFTAAKIMAGYAGEGITNPDAMSLLLTGRFAGNFWVGEVGMTFIIPLALLLIARRNVDINGLFTAALIGLAGLFIGIYDLIMAGQLVPHFVQYNIVGLPKYYSYTPSLHEYMMLAGGFFLVFTLFILGELLLRPDRLSVDEK